MNNNFIQIDNEGYFLVNNERLQDQKQGLKLIEGLFLDKTLTLKTTYEDKNFIVEAFDQPIYVLNIHKTGESLVAEATYGFSFIIDLNHFFVDEWDRFLGKLDSNVSYLLSSQAQEQLFNIVDEFDDDSLTFMSKKYQTPNWMDIEDKTEAAQYWNSIYNEKDANNEQPGWELNTHHPSLEKVLPQLKIPKCRIAVLGCGSGNDAAFFAEQGHIVTAIDFSDEALKKAKQKYGHIKNLLFVKADVFNLPKDFNNSFDLVFEHTCYCAINPGKRNDLVKIWQRLLADEGHILGIFFSMTKQFGPPYGGSEWELKKRLEKNFDLYYWTRWKDEPAARLGKELVVYAKLKTTP